MVTIGGCEIRFTTPEAIPTNSFIGHEAELAHCAAAWGVDFSTNSFHRERTSPMHFRLHGAAGVGKSEIVFELARRLKRNLFVMTGHENLTAEDLALVLVPDRNGAAPLGFSLRASPLATALYQGDLVYLDGINRIPEKTLSCLASLLDDRKSIYSAIAGIRIGPRDMQAAESFRFCCSVDGNVGQRGGILPDYIAQRCLPIIVVGPLSREELLKIHDSRRLTHRRDMTDFKKQYCDDSQEQLKVYALGKIADWVRLDESSPDESVGDQLDTLALNEKLLGPGHPSFRRLLFELAAHLGESEHYAHSIRLWRRFIDSEYLGASADEVLIEARKALAYICLQFGKHQEAERELLALFEALESQRPPDDPALVGPLNLRAIWHVRMGYYKKAEEFHKKAFEIHSTTASPKDLLGATLSGNLGVLFWYAGRYGEARPLLEGALKIQTQALGENHIENAIIMNSVARLRLRLDKVDSARKMYETVLSIRAKHGIKHSDEAFPLDGLARLFLITGDLPAAARYAEQALSLRTHRLGVQHPLTAASLLTRGKIYQASNERLLARDCYTRALSAGLIDLRPDHPTIALIQGALGDLFREESNFIEATQLLESALNTLERELGPDRPPTAEVHLSMARLHRSQGNQQGALDSAGRALNGYRTEFDRNHRDVVAVSTFLAGS